MLVVMILSASRIRLVNDSYPSKIDGRAGRGDEEEYLRQLAGSLCSASIPRRISCPLILNLFFLPLYQCKEPPLIILE